MLRRTERQIDTDEQTQTHIEGQTEQIDRRHRRADTETDR